MRRLLVFLAALAASGCSLLVTQDSEWKGPDAGPEAGLDAGAPGPDAGRLIGCSGCMDNGTCRMNIDALHCGAGGQPCEVCTGATPVCRLGGCVGCAFNSDCTFPAANCSATDWKCHSCADFGCTCQANGLCEHACDGCWDGTACHPPDDPLHCGPPGGNCSTCSSPTAACRFGACLGCASNADCASPTPLCDTALWQCVGCAELGCPTNSACLPDGSCSSPCSGCTSEGNCYKTDDPAHCGSGGQVCAVCSGETPVCRLGACVGCAANSDCPASAPTCKAGEWRCHSCKDPGVGCPDGSECQADGSCSRSCDGCFDGTCRALDDAAHCGTGGGACTACSGETPVCRFGTCVGCASDADCAAPAPICNTGQWRCRSCVDLGCPENSVCDPETGACSNPCSGCTASGNCFAGDKAARCGSGGQACTVCAGETPVCRFGVCVGCASGADCKAPTPICNSGQWKCRSCKELGVGCPGGGECQADGSCTNACAGCDDGTCREPDDPAHCGPAGGTCSACSGATPHCRFGTCVGCSTGADCKSPTPICNSGQWQCRSCKDLPCPANSTCLPDGSCSAPCNGCTVADGTCYPGDSDAAHCGSGGLACQACSGATPLCRYGVCVGCAKDSDCSAPTPRCNSGQWQCRSCKDIGCPGDGVCQSDGSCSNPCEGCWDGTCRAPDDEQHCGSNAGPCATCSAAAPVCRYGCVGCATNSDCSPPTPLCNSGEWKCRSCLDLGCPAGQACYPDGSCQSACDGCVQAGVCYPLDDAHCGPPGGACTPCSGATPFCSGGSCVACRTGADCPSPNTICRYGACVGCATDSDCDPPTPRCNTGQWQCRSCNDLPCPSGQSCQSDGSCSAVCTGCLSDGRCYPVDDAHCSAPGGSCAACSGATPFCSGGSCVACRTGDDCPSASPTCRFGSCVACASNSDCKSPTPLCNSGQWQCRSCQEIGCPGSGVCQPDGSCTSSCNGCFEGTVCQSVSAAHCGPVGGSCTACSGATPLCDAATGACVACLSNADCSAPNSLCRYGACVGCASSSDCSPPKPLCNSGLWQCIACTGPSSCGGQVCHANGACSASCEGCYVGEICHPIDDAHCGPSGGACTACGGSTPSCSASGSCVACLSALDCPPASPLCRYGSCVGCESNSDCGGTKPYCNSGQWQCIACNSSASCGGKVCNSDGSCSASCNGCLYNGLCHPVDGSRCTEAGGGYCPTGCSGATPYCDASGACVACRSGADCSAPNSVCRSGACVGCATSSDCASPTPLCNSGQWQCRSCQEIGCFGTSVCQPDGSCASSCAGCFEGTVCYPVSAAHCGPVGGTCAACSGATPYCDAAGTCVACRSNSDCSAPNSICRYGACVGCQSNSDCGGTKPYCNSGLWQCVACTSSSSCGGKVCNADGSCSASCDGCTYNGVCYPVDGAHCSVAGGTYCPAGCSGATPYCDASGACVGCLSSAHCSAPNPICRYGACVGCQTNSDCGGTKPSCNSGLWQCVACTSSSSCGGQVCNSNGSCSASCNGCMNNGVCYPVDGSRCTQVGGGYCASGCSGATPYCGSSNTCVACLSSADCSAPNSICRFGACVQCQSNSDCSGTKPVCNSGAWQCIACSSSTSCGGQVCNSNGSCSASCNGCLYNGICYPVDGTRCGVAGGTYCPTACSGATPWCSSSGSCVGCLTSAHCSAPKDLCRAGTCVECQSNSDCAGTTPYCNSGLWACIACSDSASCGGQVCNSNGSCSASCNGCMYNGKCYPVDGVHCDVVGGGYCPSGCSGATPYCGSSSTCVACLSNANCTSPTGICRFGSCVQCASNSDCSAPKPICNSGAWQCIACSSSASCGGQVCNSNGSCTATCNGCYSGGICYPIDAAHCGPVGGSCGTACSGATPVCSGGSCVACTSDAQCAGASTGFLCKSLYGYGTGCGCTTPGSSSNCPSGKSCNAGPWICQ